MGVRGCYSCGSVGILTNEELREVEIHSGPTMMCDGCAERHAANVAMKTKIIDDWQERNRRLEKTYDGMLEANRQEPIRAWNHFWRRLWVRWVRVWRWL